MLSRRHFTLSAAAAAQTAPAPPNVLFILCDQWRRHTMPGTQSSPLDQDLIAPNLAKLTAQSVNFSRAYVSNPVCTPSRATLQTGMYPHAVDMPSNDRLLPIKHPCLAQQFSNAGYRTGYIGKWHLDGDQRPGFVPPGPRRRGYQYWAAFNRGHFYFNSTYFLDTPDPIRRSGFEPDYQTDLAIDFLKAGREKPFFLFLSYGPPHTPRTPPERHANTYQPENFHLRENVPAAYADQARKGAAGYYGLCTALDDNVGRLLKALDETGQAQNTIVVFTADHGDMLGSHGLEYKGVPFEESTGVPLLMRWPAKLKASSTQDWLFNNVDMMPTLCGLAGVAHPEGLHGQNRAQLILEGKGPRPESTVVQGRLSSDGEWRMIVRGWDKLVVDRQMQVTHLFNLAQDPFEKNNLASGRAATRLQEELLSLLRRHILLTADRVPYPVRNTSNPEN